MILQVTHLNGEVKEKFPQEINLRGQPILNQVIEIHRILPSTAHESFVSGESELRIRRMGDRFEC